MSKAPPALLTKILIIEDEPAVSDFLKSALSAHQYHSAQADNGARGIQAARDFKPDVIILDLGLPDQSGLSVMRQIRESSKTPIIVLTASDSDQDKVAALDKGADDYLTKPFSVPELMARIRVALRHSTPGQTEKLVHGRLEIDIIAHRAYLDQKPLKLTSTEFAILKVLLNNSGKVVTHRSLLNEVWGPNSVEHTQYLRVYVGHLRKKLNINNSADLIVTEPGIGYRLMD